MLFLRSVYLLKIYTDVVTKEIRCLESALKYWAEPYEIVFVSQKWLNICSFILDVWKWREVLMRQNGHELINAEIGVTVYEVRLTHLPPSCIKFFHNKKL